jgi:hypothetical protein
VEEVVLNERLMTCADAKQELLAMGLTDVQADAVVAQAVQAMTARLGLILGGPPGSARAWSTQHAHATPADPICVMAFESPRGHQH